MCPSTTPGFSPMPPTAIMSGVGVAGGMPQPAPFPNMPTAVMPTVPTDFFHICGYLLPIQEKTQRKGPRSKVGRDRTPSFKTFSTSCTWAALIS